MALNLDQSRVNFENVTFQPMLTDLQANILKGHGRNYAHHIFVHFDKAKIDKATQWINFFAKARITSAIAQLNAVKGHHETGADGGPISTLSLSASGYKALGVKDAETPGDTSFRGGMQKSADKLKDSPAQWEEDFQAKSVDMLVIVADDDHEKAQKLADEIKAQISSFGHVVKDQKGKGLNRFLDSNSSIGIEHFGYADGVSQPLYLEDEIKRQNDNKVWKDEEKLGILLVKDPGGKNEDSFGSYFVFRKLEQNVLGFKRNEGDVKQPDKKFFPNALPRVKNAAGTNNDDLPGAMVVGRFENGSPVVLNDGEELDIKEEKELQKNDFDYKGDAHGSASNGSKCPFHAHVRIANPRNDVGEFAHQVRLTRRGMPYDDINRFGKGFENEINFTGDQLDDNLPANGVGLLFMCYQANIGKQFEFIQSTWVNEGDIGGKKVGQDGLIGQGDAPNHTEKFLPRQFGKPDHADKPIQFGGHVKMRGGEYFFTPSLSFLRNI